MSEQIDPREKLLSHFAFLVGGFNAVAGLNSGRLKGESLYDDDDKAARHLLNCHYHDATSDLLAENRRLRAELHGKDPRKIGSAVSILDRLEARETQLERFRDAVLNERFQLEEGTLNNDQINAVLALFDDQFGPVGKTISME